ncbi:MAG: SirB2 family protein [Burkholderiales bacterium]
MDYIVVRNCHIACAIMSGGFFLVRGMWMLRESPILRLRWVKTLPHIIDSVLLGCALALVIASGQYPLAQNWLTAKVIALAIYIALGTVALKSGQTKSVRAGAFIAALLVFFYIGLVAITKQVVPFA